MTDQYFKELKSELQLAMTEKDHPLRYCTLATVGLDQVARLRTIVVRDISDDFVFTFYTDLRSKKIIHIKENNKVSLLFFHPKKMLQLKVEGVAQIKKDPTILKPLWKTVEPMSKKNYTTVLTPGSTLDYPDRVE